MKPRKRLSPKKIIAHITAYENSDQSISEYCHAHQLKRGTFYNWLSRYNVDSKPSFSRESFVALTLDGLNDDHATILARLEHPNGCSISFYNDCTPEFLSQTIKHL